MSVLSIVRKFGTIIGLVRNYLAAVAFLTGVVAWVIVLSRDRPSLLVILAAAGIFAIGTIAGVVGAISWLNRHRADYRIVEARYEYSFDDADLRCQTQESQVTIEARRHNVQLYRAKYSYTGTGSSELEILSSGCRLLVETSRDSDWQTYYVLLPHPLRKGAKQKVRLKQKMFDEAGEFQPLLSKTVVEPLDKLELSVQFPSRALPSEIRAVELKHRAREWIFHKEYDAVLDPGTRATTFAPPRVRRGARYEVVWVWDAYP